MKHRPGRLRIRNLGLEPIRIGRGLFYPEGLRLKDRFAYYAARFDTGGAQRLLLTGCRARRRWRGGVTRAPPGFVFAWKVSRYITQAKRLQRRRRLGGAGLWPSMAPARRPGGAGPDPAAAADETRRRAAGRFPLRLLPEGRHYASSSATRVGTRPRCSRLLAGDERRPVRLGPSRRASPGDHGQLRLCARSRAGRPPCRPLSKRELARWAERIGGLAIGRPRRLRLFRQRHRRRRPLDAADLNAASTEAADFSTLCRRRA